MVCRRILSNQSYHIHFSLFTQILTQDVTTPALLPPPLPELPHINHLFLLAVLICGTVYLMVLFVLL